MLPISLDSRWRSSRSHMFKKIGILTLILFALYQLHQNIVFYSNPVHRCTLGIRLPRAISNHGQVKKTWDQLQELFKDHHPEPKLARAEFAKTDEGSLAKLSEELLKDFLNISVEEANAMRSMHADMVEKIPSYPADGYSGRGIVMVAGGKYSEYATTTVGMLRIAGSRLPIEMWMLNLEEEKRGWCAELAEEGVVCRCLSDYLDMSAFDNPFQYKTAAMFFSSFEEILFLDSDNIPLINPDDLFDSDTYKEAGAILWPDYWQKSESPWTPYITGESDRKREGLPDNQKTVESGQMMWDKKRHWRALCLVTWYNQFGPHYFYTLITQGGAGWGDKDTFPTALRALHDTWVLVPQGIHAVFYNDGSGKGRGTGMSMMQADPRDRDTFHPIFLHSNFVKPSVRRIMCDKCVEDKSALKPEQRKKGEIITFAGQINIEKGEISALLKEGKRFFSKEGTLEKHNMDPEMDMWRVMERAACAGVWSDELLCERTRGHLERAFGVTEKDYWRGASC